MNGAFDFFDSNVLIAAAVQTHIHHAAASARLKKLASGRGACSTHTLAETYTNLTRFGKGYGMELVDSLAVLSYARDTFTLVSLTPAETLNAIEVAARIGLRGAVVYDALLVACARKVNARRIYTNNVKHFCQVAPDLTAIIREP